MVLAACLVSPLNTWAGLEADQLGLIINAQDPASVATGEYFAARRNIPAENIVLVDLPAGTPTIDPAVFKRIITKIKNHTPERVQAYALAWTLPYRVDCMSITTAFALGYGKRYCAKGCRATAPNPYYNSKSSTPYNDFKMRPAMLIAGTTVENTKFLIDRGVQSDGTRPQGKAYFVITDDKARNTRIHDFEQASQEFLGRIPVSVSRKEGIENKFDVMFYFIGATRVPHINSLGFLPGAIADHLTSAGGKLTDSKQMSSLRWLEAGATGSYGTVVEPCNFPHKFPNPVIAMDHYLNGDTLIEAYWKSVLWPGQGLFIGEPLARPYKEGHGT